MLVIALITLYCITYQCRKYLRKVFKNLCCVAYYLVYGKNYNKTFIELIDGSRNI